MSGLAGLANWALGGGAGSGENDDSSNKDATTSTEKSQLSESELREKRLAKMIGSGGDEDRPQSGLIEDSVMKSSVDDGIGVGSKVESEGSTLAEPMEIDEEDRKLPAIAPKPAPSSMKPSVVDMQRKKKAKSVNESSSLRDTTPAKKLQRKKEILLKKVLGVFLSSSSLTFTDKNLVMVVMDDCKVTVQNIAEILAGRLSLPADSASLSTGSAQKAGLVGYLGHCHKMASEELKAMRRKVKKDEETKEIEDLLEEIKRQVVSYAATSLMEPDLFELGSDGTAQLALCLSNGSSDPASSITFGASGSSSSFYFCLCEELISQDLDSLSSIIHDTTSHLMKSLSKYETLLDSSPGNSGGGALACVSALTSICLHKKAALCLTRHKSFLLPESGSEEAKERVTPPIPTPPAGSTSQQQRIFRMMQQFGQGKYLKRSGPALEKETILGLVLKIGLPMDNQAVNSNFSNAATRTMADVNKSIDSMRRQLRIYQEGCNAFMRALVTAGSDARKQVMRWIIDALLVNIGASATRPDKSKVSNIQTLLNLCVILLKLCEPFVADLSKIHLIDPRFVSSEEDHGGVFSITGDDAVHRLAESPVLPTTLYNPKNTFIPQCFFFTARAIYLGIVPAAAFHTSIRREVSITQWQLRQRGGNAHSISSNPNFNHILGRQHASEVTVLVPEMLSDALRFYNVCAGFMLNISDDYLRLMPEHFLDDICDLMMFVAKNSPRVMRGLEFGNVFKLVVKLLSPEYAQTVRNYNLRAKLGDVLYKVFLPQTDDMSIPSSVSSDSSLGGQPFLLSDKSAQETLAPSLLLLYGEVEFTGFWEKMTHREHIASLLKYLWESKEHRPAFRRITQNKESFIKFANGIMNETNALISSVMEKLPEIRRVQVQMASPQWASIPEEERESISSRHDENENEVRRALPLCNKTLQMLGFLNTDPDIRNLFLLDEMCPRLVNMLLHVLTKLVGAKGLDLKVDNPENYEFRPREMLRDLCSIFASFSEAPEFQVESAKSGYYSSTLVDKSVKTCRKYNLLTEENQKRFALLPAAVKEAARHQEDDNALTADAPDEFLDPLMATFMRDPVLLPTSNNIIDRATITQHLLNDPHDPFNRKELSIDMVLPAVEHKEKMNKWLEAKKAARKNE